MLHFSAVSAVEIYDVDPFVSPTCSEIHGATVKNDKAYYLSKTKTFNSWSFCSISVWNFTQELLLSYEICGVRSVRIIEKSFWRMFAIIIASNCSNRLGQMYKMIKSIIKRFYSPHKLFNIFLTCNEWCRSRYLMTV